MIGGNTGRQHDADPVGGMELLAGKNPGQQRQRCAVAAHHRQHIVAAKGDGRGADADLEVVIAVDHGVFGVVGDGPEDVGHQHDPGRQRHGTGERGIAHRDAKAKGNAQIRLRNGKEALEERIAAGQDGGHDGQPPHQRPVGKYQRQRQQAEHHENGHGLPWSDLAPGQRPVDGARHGAVEIAVGEVVDGTAGRAHQHGAQAEGKERVERRPAIGRHEECPQGGPDQQQDADGLVEAHQPDIERQPLPAGVVSPAGRRGCRRVHSGSIPSRRAACRATTHSSLVGCTTTLTALSGVEMTGPFRVLASWSSRMPK